MNIIRKSRFIETKHYDLVFECNDLPGAGFSFPCDEQGNVLLNEMPPPAQENLYACLSGEIAVTAQGVRMYTLTYREPAQGRCSNCEQVVELIDAMTNTCECGWEYNGGGQLLAPRSQWEECF